MSELEKALEYTQQELNKKFGGNAISDEEACDVIYDCLEQYGDDNDLPEGWWMEYGDFDAIVVMLQEWMENGEIDQERIEQE